MAERVTHSICVGGPIAIHTQDGVIRRIRPIVFDQNDPKGWGHPGTGRGIYPQPQDLPRLHRPDGEKPLLLL